MVRCSEGGPDRRPAIVQNGAIDVTVDPVVLEILVGADVELSAIAIVGAVKDTAVDHRCGAWQVGGGRGPASPRKHLRRGLKNTSSGSIRGWIAGQNLGAESIREILLRPTYKLGIFEGGGAVSCRSGSAQGLDGK